MLTTLQRNAQHFPECKSVSVKISDVSKGAKCDMTTYTGGIQWTLTIVWIIEI